MNKIELINFLKSNVNGNGDLDRDVIIITGKKQGYKEFNLLPFGKSKTKIGYYDEGFKIFTSTQKIDDLGIFIDELDHNYNILYVMTTIDKVPYYYLDNNQIENTMTINEAAEIWNVAESSIRYHISNGRLVTGVDYRKAGRITLITKRAMIKLFGDIPGGKNE